MTAMRCLPKYLPIEAEAAVRRANEQDASDGVIGRTWVSEHCRRCGYEHLIRRVDSSSAGSDQ